MAGRQHMESDHALAGMVSTPRVYTGRRVSRRRDRSRIRLAMTSIIALCAGAMLAGAAGYGVTKGILWLSNQYRARSHAALAQMSVSFINAMQTGDDTAMLNLCVEGPEGSHALGTTSASIYTDESSRADNLDEAIAQRKALLEEIRQDLEKQGVHWEEAQAIAFSGIRAEVKHNNLMRKPIEIVIGDIYFKSGSALYAIEVSARGAKALSKGGPAYIIDVWNWSRVDATEATLKTYAKGRVKQFQSDESQEEGIEAELDGIKALYVPVS